jgi:hypothetical protein
VKRFSWILTLPLLVIAVVFSVSNRQAIMFDIWPFDLTVTLPAFVPVLGALFIGFVAGGIVAWISAGRTRARARAAERDLQSAQFELSRLKREQERRRSEAGMEARALAAPSSASLVSTSDAKLRAGGGAARSAEA